MDTNEKNKNGSPLPLRPTGTSCLYLAQPLAGCYCRNITSLKVAEALTYCGGDYRRCPVFQRVGAAKCAEERQAGSPPAATADAMVALMSGAPPKDAPE